MKSEVDRLFNVIRGRKKNTEPENGENSDCNTVPIRN
mgnify:CR=1 FL=1